GETPGPSALCFGETLVDLICPVRGVGFESAPSIEPRLGGAPTNVAVIAAALGVDVAIAGGVGADQWGDWLARRLRDEGVSLRHWHRLEGVPTVVAFVVIDEEAVPDYLIYGEGLGPVARAFAPHVDEAAAESAVGVLGSNTMVGEEERAVTMALRERALERGAGVLFDANLRIARWRDRELAVELCRTACEGALLVKANMDEVRLLTGDSDPVSGAQAICRLGARNALVTSGADGAVIRGEVSAEADAVPARVVDTTGAGDAMTGAFVAALTRGGGTPEALRRALPLGAFLAARATESLGALAGDALAKTLAETDRRGLSFAT
ncbi:MAG: fructokinase, partial [Gaiellales bacterium]|nr:fructokinase [Gaiellales bacterium]